MFQVSWAPVTTRWLRLSGRKRMAGSQQRAHPHEKPTDGGATEACHPGNRCYAARFTRDRALPRMGKRHCRSSSFPCRSREEKAQRLRDKAALRSMRSAYFT
jgi:hypothetical protein